MLYGYSGTCECVFDDAPVDFFFLLFFGANDEPVDKQQLSWRAVDAKTTPDSRHGPSLDVLDSVGLHPALAQPTLLGRRAVELALTGFWASPSRRHMSPKQSRAPCLSQCRLQPRPAAAGRRSSGHSYEPV
jgi:hypothetical protein